MQAGTFYAVSVGPGGSDKLTLEAIQVLERCPVICFPETDAHAEQKHHIAYDAVNGAVSLSEKKLLFFPIAMTRNREKILEEYHRIAMSCAEVLHEGKDVAFCAIGDVSLYATAWHIAALVEDLGFTVSFVSGVNSFSAAACAAGLSLVDRDDSLTIIPGDAFYSKGKLEAALRAEGTKVLMKHARHLSEILLLIDRLGLLGDSVLVQKASMADQRIIRGQDLRSLGDDVMADAYLSLLIVQGKGK